MKIKELQNKKIAILWFWKEGQGSLRFLQKIGVTDITVLDANPIADIDVTSITGESYMDDLAIYDCIIKTPGITPFQEKLEPYRGKFISQTSIFFANYTWKVIAITGTKGKSTISTLLYECLKEAWYNVKLVGNIGKPVLDEIDILGNEEYDYIIYEMSSYMLQDFEPQTYISVFNNVYRCHIDWHGSLEVYTQAKLNVLKNAQYKIINSEFQDKASGQYKLFGEWWHYRYQNKIFYIWDQEVLQDENILLEWEHNRKNICGVIGVLDTIFWDISRLQRVLKTVLRGFSGLPERMERIGQYNGVTFINDAIATTPESTMAALKTFEDRLQTLFLWGEDSWFDFSELRKKILQSNIQNIITFPDSSEKVFPEITWYWFDEAFELDIEWKKVFCIRTRSMQSGVDFAYKHTKPWNIALLSCASPSFSVWKSYKVKAEEFKKYVKQKSKDL